MDNTKRNGYMEFSSNSEEHKEQKRELVGYLCDKFCERIFRLSFKDILRQFLFIFISE